MAAIRMPEIVCSFDNVTLFTPEVVASLFKNMFENKFYTILRFKETIVRKL